MPILNANCSVLARCTIQSSLLKLNAIFQVSTVSENSLKSLDIFKCLKMSLVNWNKKVSDLDMIMTKALIGDQAMPLTDKDLNGNQKVI